MKTGDTVRFTEEYLRNAERFIGKMPELRGKVIKVHEPHNVTLIEVDFDTSQGTHTQCVFASNLEVLTDA